MKDDIVIVSATRTPVGAFNGAFANLPAHELGKTAIKDAEIRKKLAAEFKSGVEDSIGAAAACFNPRHRLTAKHKGKAIDLLICFECLQVQCSIDDQKPKTVLISPTPQAYFDRVLKDAGVKLAPKATE